MNLKISPAALAMILLFSQLPFTASVGSQGIPNPDRIIYATMIFSKLLIHTGLTPTCLQQ
jgi:hypothetical protein